jgi:alkanesulfonate monooxygenase SsuD/methylene tetrahydromethanopterin reductase-like flavin-dependent oxidoreductase (luciferase family)
MSEQQINETMKLTGVRKFIIIGKTDKEAEDVAIAATARLQGTMQRLLTTSEGAKESTVRTASGEMVTLDHTDVRESPIFGNHLYGTPDTIVRKLIELEEVGGMSHCICVFGGAENGLSSSKESIKLFAKEILPVIQKHRSATPAAV